MSKIPMVDLYTQYLSIKKEVYSILEEVIKKSSFINGEFVEKLEQEIAQFCTTHYAVSVGTGTDALYLSLWAVGIKPGDEVITTPFTFFATAEVIALLGATPVFVDIDPTTFNIDVSQIEAKVNIQTKAIIPVHLFGLAADMDPIINLAKKHNLHIIEDACQAIGATYKNTKVGSLGTTGCFSFFPSKNLGAWGDGGMVVTNNRSLAEKIKILRNHGSKRKYFNEEIGISSRLDALQAAILSVKLTHLEEWNNKRIKIAKKYNSLLSGISWIKPPEYDETKCKHVFNQYTVLITNGKRNLVQSKLLENGIASNVYYPIPLHLIKALSYLKYKKGDLPRAEQACEEVLSLPLYPEMDDKKIMTVSKTLHSLSKIIS